MAKESKFQKVRTRFAPSPTGHLHVGGIRTALYSYAWAKHNNGDFVLRIEDTDQERGKQEYADEIVEALKVYGLDDYEGPFVQSERLDIYRGHIQKLIEKGDAYYCFCSPERLEKIREKARKRKDQPMYDRHCLKLSEDEVHSRLDAGEPHVIRLKVPRGQELKYKDVVMGEVKFNTDVVDDQVLIKSDGFPTYQFAVVVDDHEMEISHITRGVEWISSTPKQILLYKAFGWKIPEFAHLPVFLDPESGKGKMSKRRGTTAALGFIEEGYLPEAVLNFLMLLGWAPKNDRELFTLDEFIEAFTLDRINKSNPVFDRKKLVWFNKQYISGLSAEEFVDKFIKWLSEHCPSETRKKYKVVIEGIKKDKARFKEIAELVKDRVSTCEEVLSMVEFFYVDEVEYKKEDWEGLKPAEALEALKKAFAKPWKGHDDWEARVRKTADDLGWKHGDLFMALRLAVAGSKVSTPLRESMDILGHKKSLARIESALRFVPESE